MVRKFCRYKKLVGLLAMGACTGMSHPAWSAAFQLNEQNAAGLGTAFAGVGSIAEDASTGYYNPAGLSRIGEQIAGSLVWVNSGSKVTLNQNTNTSGIGIPGGTTRSKNNSVLPALHYAKEINCYWAFGINIASPFGLKNSYRDDSVVRYFATRSELRTTDISPSIAYDFQNGLSVGAGVDAVFLDAKLDSALSSGVFPDGVAQSSARDWGWGYHAGILYQLSDCTRFGLTYRSKVSLKPKGDFTAFAFIPGVGFTNIRTGVQTRVTLPETATFSAYHAFNEQWAVMGDVSWTHWKRFQDLTLTLSQALPGTNAQQTVLQNYRDSYRVAVGASYQYDCFWRFRVGTAFDRTPSRDGFRTVNIPDQNRIWAAVGAQYRFTERLALDMGYAHLFFKKAQLNENYINFNRNRQILQGNSKGRADLVGIQLTWDLV